MAGNLRARLDKLEPPTREVAITFRFWIGCRDADAVICGGIRFERLDGESIDDFRERVFEGVPTKPGLVPGGSLPVVRALFAQPAPRLPGGTLPPASEASR